MIKHLLKQIWKQRRYNGLMIIEIIFSFIAIFVISIVVIQFSKLYNEPTGMEYKNVWYLSVNQPWDISKELRISDSLAILKLDHIKKHIINNYKEVKYITKANSFSTPYTQSMTSGCEDYRGKQFCYNTSPAEPDFAKTFGMKMVEGRWFLPEDIASGVKTVTINRKLKEELFGKEPAAGKTIYVGKPKTYPIKIAGVFDAIKRSGEFSEEPNFMFENFSFKEYQGNPFESMAIQTFADIEKDFEARLVSDLMKFDKTFEYRIEKAELLRKQYIISELAPVIIVGAIVLFLIVNVMLGLFGTLWLNISRRKSEIGLRRAVGSPATTVLWQILGETYGLAIISIIIGLVFTSQLFIFNIYDTPVTTLLLANLVAFLIILILCTISAYAPARLASRLEPATALHEE